ncbi:MAG: NAD(+)/NADH kinase [Prevotella sp.]|nr:NAD(+)/NADH kinase [Bacteroides sp.]MCM1365700.1 NAD(+)/NADH kinase [Prevotella sp.]MCM1436370.1 NAD(+)/NADH kinase [Prevotella sp.]
MSECNFLTKVERAALFGNHYQERHLSEVQRLVSLLREHNLKIYIEEDFAQYLIDSGVELPPEAIMVKDLPEDTDVIFSIGGDGTFLHAAQWCGDSQIPIVGINTGHLGFLSNCPADESHILIDEMMTGSLRYERRALLQISGVTLPDGFWPFALNEIAVTKEETSSMITVSTFADGHFVADYLGDGLVISTPTGSTAYNLALGGPILQPTLGCALLTPIAPHSLTFCPLVVSGESIIECTTHSRAANYRVTADGRSFIAPCGTVLKISRAPFRIVTLRRPGDNFAATLRHKLHWGSR